MATAPARGVRPAYYINTDGDVPAENGLRLVPTDLGSDYGGAVRVADVYVFHTGFKKDGVTASVAPVYLHTQGETSAVALTVTAEDTQEWPLVLKDMPLPCVFLASSGAGTSTRLCIRLVIRDAR